MTEQIWLKNPKDLTDDEYISFYKSISNTKGNPLGVKHFSFEGGLNIIGILFCPPQPTLGVGQKYQTLFSTNIS